MWRDDFFDVFFFSSLDFSRIFLSYVEEKKGLDDHKKRRDDGVKHTTTKVLVSFHQKCNNKCRIFFLFLSVCWYKRRRPTTTTPTILLSVKHARARSLRSPNTLLLLLICTMMNYYYATTKTTPKVTTTTTTTTTTSNCSSSSSIVFYEYEYSERAPPRLR